ncbi:MAG: ATP-binding protein [Burkholderiaceae bacterium]|nr:ATP-binding protein [Burkholderiaceae bacterium]
MKIAVVGAPATGKTALVSTLASHLDTLQVSDAPSPDTLQTGRYDRVLLMGLDQPGVTPAQQAADAALRAQLAATGLAFGVVYGKDERERLCAALRLIDPQDGPAPRWTGVCEKCADPDCELRLFTALKNSKAAEHPPA